MCEFDHKDWKPMNRCFWIAVLKETLESLLDSKEITPVNPKGNQLWIFIGRTNAGAPKLWPPDAKSSSNQSWLIPLMLGKVEGKRRRGRQRMRCLDSIINMMDMNVTKPQETAEDRRAWQAAVHDVAKSQTWLSNWTTTKLRYVTQNGIFRKCG